MPDPNPAALDFLLTRRSRPAKTLRKPAPEGAVLDRIIEAGLRVPDHGKLEPWRLVVFRADQMPRLAELAQARGAATGVAAEKVEKAANSFAAAPMIVMVVTAPVDSDKIPEIEQLLSAGCVCLSLVNAALASGYGANWVTGFAAHDPEFGAALGLSTGESIAGFIHMGTETAAPPERPRPDVAQKVVVAG